MTASLLTILGGDKNDIIIGSDGDDRIDGGIWHDTIDGGKGDDTLVASAGSDDMSGGKGNDTVELRGNLGADDTLDGGANFDTLRNVDNTSAIRLHGINDGVYVSNFEQIVGKNNIGGTTNKIEGVGQSNTFNFTNIVFDKIKFVSTLNGDDTVTTSTKGNNGILYDGGNGSGDTIVVAFTASQFAALSAQEKQDLFDYLDAPTARSSTRPGSTSRRRTSRAVRSRSTGSCWMPSAFWPT